MNSRFLAPYAMTCGCNAGLQQIVTNFSKTAEGVSGPVAIVAVGSEIARSDLAGLLQFAAIVNINLAVVNALPLPALDGGFLALLIAEAVRGEAMSKYISELCLRECLLLKMLEVCQVMSSFTNALFLLMLVRMLVLKVIQVCQAVLSHVSALP